MQNLFNTLSQFINKSIHLFLIMIKKFMKNQNHLYLSKLKKTKYSLEKSLNDLEQYDLDEAALNIKILKDRIKENQKQIIALAKEINNS